MADWYWVYYTREEHGDQLFVHSYCAENEKDAVAQFLDHRGREYSEIVEVRKTIMWGD